MDDCDQLGTSIRFCLIFITFNFILCFIFALFLFYRIFVPLYFAFVFVLFEEVVLD